PVDPGHVRLPEVPPHQPARLVVGAPPQLHRILAEAGAGQVDRDGVTVVVAGLAAGRYHLDTAVVLDHRPLAVPADGEVVEPVPQLGALALGEIEPLQRRTRRRRVRAGPGLAENAAEWPV